MALAGGLFRGKRMPPQGRFNAGQKVNSILVVGLTLAFVVTGTLLMAKGQLPFWLAAGVLFCHKVLAVTGGALLVGHVSMAVLTPHGRGGLKAMVKGILPAHIAREGHSIWYAEWLRHNRREDAGL
jgi:formate dehydrogenase subunit gamma